MPLPAAIALVTQLATAVPALMKFVGASDTHVDIAEHVVDVAKQVTGIADGTKASMAVLDNPEKMAEFKLRVNEQMLTWEQMYLKDIDSARQRDVEMRKAGYRNYRGHSMYVLAVVIIAILVWQVLASDNLNEYAKGIITLVLGRFLGYLDNIYNFEFGTTRNSQTKDETIKKLTNGHGS